MAEYYEQLENYLIWPSENDHHGDDYQAGAGIIMTEWLKTASDYYAVGSRNVVATGFAVTDAGSPALGLNVSAGRARIAGYYIEGTDQITNVLTFNGTYYVFLKLEMSAGLAVRPLIEVTTEKTSSTYKVLLARVVAAGGDISTVTDARFQGRIIYGKLDYATPAVSHFGSGDWWYTDHGSSDCTISYDIEFLQTPMLFTNPVVVPASQSASAFRMTGTTNSFIAIG